MLVVAFWSRAAAVWSIWPTSAASAAARAKRGEAWAEFVVVLMMEMTNPGTSNARRVVRCCGR
jgi:hypothetical protein